jgi:hypothetical protein
MADWAFLLLIFLLLLPIFIAIIRAEPYGHEHDDEGDTVDDD